MQINQSNPLSKIPELRNRLLFTLAMLAVYRVGIQVPTPGVDIESLKMFFSQQSNTLFGFFNMFSGGALENYSIFSLGIMPYISVSIIMQLLSVSIPALERLNKEEGEQGRKKLTQYTRYGTVVLSIIQALMISRGLENMKLGSGGSVVIDPGWSFRMMSIVTLTTGTMFIMWLGEQITERGIGNGISLIIFASIVSGMIPAMGKTFTLLQSGEIQPFMFVGLIALMVVVVAVIIFFERAMRRVPVQYAKRVVGRKVYGGQNTHLPLKINQAGVIPPIFASSLMVFPSTLATFLPQGDWLQGFENFITPGGWLYNTIFVGMIVFFCYFYTAVTFNPVDIADNIKKMGGYIPGIRPGKPTSDYIDRILSRITLGGAVYLSAICVLPWILFSKFNIPFYFGGTSLLIAVGVAVDTVEQIEMHLITRNYDGFMRRGRQRARGRR